MYKCMVCGGPVTELYFNMKTELSGHKRCIGDHVKKSELSSNKINGMTFDYAIIDDPVSGSFCDMCGASTRCTCICDKE